MIAYHFVGSTLRDGRPVPPDGVWLEHDGPIAICESGLHASRRPWHALQFAPGGTLCLVEVADIVEEERNKLVARRRRIVRRVDLTADLRAFALQCARDVQHLWDAPDVVQRYLAGDEALRAAAWAATWADEGADGWIVARNAAWEAAWDATRDAAKADEMARARTAAWCAARNAVKAVTWCDAWNAAWTASDYAAQAVAWADEMARTRAAASAAEKKAAWVAAWDAARAAQGERFDAMCRARLGV